MKKLISILCLISMLFGCSSNNYDYEGTYTLIPNNEIASIVVVWKYPSDEITVDTHEVNLENLNAYIDESLDGTGPGLSLNLLLGCLGYERKFFSVKPIYISEENVNKIMKKNIKIEMDVVDKQGNSNKVGLKFDKELKKNYEENTHLINQ